MRIMTRTLATWFALLALGTACVGVEASSEGEGKTWRATVSPVAGWDRNELEVRGGPGGATSTETDTAGEQGLFVAFVHPRLVVNNFFFWANDINDADIWGNLMFANYYHKPDVFLTWNAGVGYLYHKIKPEMTDIVVSVPMVKAGPVFRVKPLGLMLNPYLGYAWERVNTPQGDEPNDSYLYGISASWHWRMITASVRYYYQDSQEADEDYNTVHARLNVGITKSLGVALLVDYMEHPGTTDTSFLMGPTLVF